MSTVERESRRCDRIDRFGTVASSVCAAHCAVCALLPVAFGALGLGMLLGHEAEWVFTLVAIAFAAGALVLGWRRHRSTVVALLLVLGIAGLLTSRGLEMGSAHHDHHGETQHTEGHTAGHTEAHADDAAATDPDGHPAGHAIDSHVSGNILAEAYHYSGAAIGVLGGLFLIAGHLLNLHAKRRRR